MLRYFYTVVMTDRAQLLEQKYVEIQCAGRFIFKMTRYFYPVLIMH